MPRGGEGIIDTAPLAFEENYEVGRLLGSGASGEVYLAHHRETGEVVALKLLVRDQGTALQRFERERVALEALGSASGVVRTLGSGTLRGKPCIAMEYVAGTPFGRYEVPVNWGVVEPLAVQLLATLSAVHALGIIHRDLNPNNVLVTDDGRVVVLDFGLARGRPLGLTLTGTGDIIGTPGYLAPEQVTGGPYDPRTDLYAVGAMLYRALSGRLPLNANNIAAFLRAKLFDTPPSLRTVASDVPSHVVACVDRLLSRHPHDRPATAQEVARQLAGDDQTIPRLRFVGREDEIRNALDALRARRSFDLTGPSGSGKTRLLEAIFERVPDTVVLRTIPSDRPLGAVAPLVPAAVLAGANSAAEVVAAIEAVLREAALNGVCVVADDFDRLDAQSQALLRRMRPEVCMVTVTSSPAPPCIEVGPLHEDALRSLIRGPEAFLHVPSGAARELRTRSRGNARQVVAEVAQWVADGTAQWDEDGSIALDRQGLRRATQRPLALDLTIDVAGFGSDADAILAWVELLEPFASVEAIVKVTGLPRWQVELELSGLAPSAVQIHDGLIRARTRGHIGRLWDAQTERAHRCRAAEFMPAGHLARVRLLTQAQAYAGLPDEALAAVRQFAADGDLERALEVLTHVAAVGMAVAPDDAEPVLRELTILVIAEESSLGAERAEELLVDASEGPLADLRTLVHLAGALTRRPAAELDPAIEALPRFADRRLEASRQTLRFRSAVRLDDYPLAAARLESMRRFAEAELDDVHARYQGFWGTLALQQSRFGEAVERFRSVAELAGSRMVRLSAQINLALAARELFDYDTAGAAARAALESARRCQHFVFEAVAVWVLRTVAYREGQSMDADPDLARVARGFDPALAMGIALNEGAVALRAGDLVTAREMGRLGADICDGLGHFEIGRRLCLALAFAAADEKIDPDALLDDLPTALPRLAYQVVGLIATVKVPSGDWSQLRQTLPAEQRQLRLEVLSYAEVDELLAGKPFRRQP